MAVSPRGSDPADVRQPLRVSPNIVTIRYTLLVYILAIHDVQWYL